MYLTHLVLLLAILVGYECGQLCLSCKNLPEGDYCPTNVKCQDNEVCFLQKYRTEHNEIRYDMGCAYPEICKKNATGFIFGKRTSDHSHILCHSCCNDTLICNANLQCNDHLHVRLQQCLTCSEINDPNACTNTTTCGKDEFCMHGYTNPFGRRRSSEVHLECETCCNDGNYCNRNLNCDHRNQKTINSTCESSGECVSNLVCLSYLCQCSSTDYYWSQHSCLLKKTVNEICSYTYQCKNSLFCSGNTCQCISDKYWNGSSCHSKISLDGTCIFSSECKVGLFCIHGKCKCDHSVDYWTGSTCSPKKSMNSSCGSTIECKETFYCVNQRCMCVDLDYVNGDICSPRKLVNSICLSDIECITSLHCIHQKCACMDEEIWDGSNCIQRKLVNSTCLSDIECKTSLHCIHQKCACMDKEIWDGSNCIQKNGPNSKCQLSSECRQPFNCINQTCKCAVTEYIDGDKCTTKAKECSDISGDKDGVYTIYPADWTKGVLTYCIMEQNKKWTVIQRRYNETVDFDRNWDEYKNGFGSAYGEYWLGNDYIHMITANGPHEIKFVITKSPGIEGIAQYSSFSVGSEQNRYVLTIAGYSGNTSDSMLYSGYNLNGEQFTTRDQDNDHYHTNCAIEYSGGWWYNKCHSACLNGLDKDRGMLWYPWAEHVKTSIMMISKI